MNMKRKRARLFAILFLSIFLLLQPSRPSLASLQAEDETGGPTAALENRLQLAVIGFAQTAGRFDASGSDSPESSLAAAMARSGQVALIDRSRFGPAIAGIGYNGSINLTKAEARTIGYAIGCDFFIIGKAETLTRSERENESHEEAIIGVMIVDGRSGTLAMFDFVNEKAEATQEVVHKALNTLTERAAGYISRMIEFRASRNRQVPNSKAEPIEDMPDEGSPLAEGFTPPEFLNRVKPEYTEQADRSDISATVEAMAVFHADGRVGDIEIIRWAGFGLDEAAARAIRSLKFKPATRNGQPVNVRALIRYNFRRINESGAKQTESASTILNL